MMMRKGSRLRRVTANYSALPNWRRSPAVPAGRVGAALAGTGKIDIRKAVAGCPSRAALATDVEKLKTWVDQLDAAFKPRPL
jgi:hypothetical protein